MRSRFIIAALTGTLFAACRLAAHDVWIQPRQFWIAPGPAAVEVWVGHAADKTHWGVANDRVLRLDAVGPVGSVDLRPQLRPGALNGISVLQFPNAGTQIVAMASNHAKNDLPADRFNDYAADEGLTLVQQTRAKAGTTNTNGREIYSRRAKALVQVGPAKGQSLHVVLPVGLTLEIVPGRDPYAAKPAADLPVQILFNGKPLAGATVKITNLAADARPVAVRQTDAAGRATFAMPRAGDWQLNVVWSVPITGNPDADFETFFSSLTFGFPRR